MSMLQIRGKLKTLPKKLSFTICFLLGYEMHTIAHKTLLISVPKSGTHLRNKCCNFLLKSAPKEIRWIGSFPGAQQQSNLPRQEKFKYLQSLYYWMVDPIKYFDYLERKHSSCDHLIVSGHMIYSTELANELIKRNYQIIVNIRDPRDVMISAAHFWKKLNPANATPVAEKISEFFLSKKHFMFSLDGYRSISLWLQHGNALLVRFEDLVGPNGGGKYGAQIDTISKIAQALNVSVSQKRVEEIAQSLYGGTFTFREGKIGSWRKELTFEQKKLFQSVPENNQLLIAMGYEKDENWI